MIRVFVVKHSPTGKYLPPMKGFHSATTRELSDTPRIFYRRRDAKRSAQWWAKGEAGTIYDRDWETGYREPAGIVSHPVEGRRLEDLFIYSAQLEFLGPIWAIT